MGASGLIIIVVGLALVIIVILALVASMFRKVGPNQALIIYGFGGTKVVVGGGSVIWPMIQQGRELSLELMSFDVTPANSFYTSQGVAVVVEAVAQIKVKSDQVSILTATEQFLSKLPAEREGLIRLVVEGHLRGIIGQLTVEQIVKEPEMVSEKVRSQVADDMSKMGLEVVSFTIREIRDDSEYIMNMGRPDIAAVKRQADIATAEAERDIAIKRAQAIKEARVAEAMADQQTIIAQTASQANQSQAVRDLEIKKADFATAVKIQQAGADKAYEIQSNIEQQRVIAEQVKIEQVRKHGEIAVQEAEILRREKELIATVLRAAEVEKKRIETIAEANRQKVVLEATGQSESIRLQGLAQADVIRAQGTAEAEIIRAKGDSEAAAMKTKAAAYQDYNEAAIIDRLMALLPEIVRAFAEPLNNIDKITVVSTGTGAAGEGVGVNKITSDMATMIAQAPALIETLTGINIRDMIRDVPRLRTSSNGHEPVPAVSGREPGEPTV